MSFFGGMKILLSSRIATRVGVRHFTQTTGRDTTPFTPKSENSCPISPALRLEETAACATRNEGRPWGQRASGAALECSRLRAPRP
jgi:hypothetical protein